MDLTALKQANADRWNKAKGSRNFAGIAKALVTSKPRYQAVEAKTGVPWFVIAVIHERESSQNWGRSLAQGDPWNRVSVHVPAGRGPFTSWEAAAVDALVDCPPHLAQHKDWSASGALTALEAYNGLGYFHGPVTMHNGVVIARYPSQPSPYLWAGTDQYKSGKYVADGVFNQSVSDVQPGCAGMILAMMAIDPTITFTGVKITPKPTVPTAPPVQPKPASGWASILSAILKLFTRK